MKSDSVGTSTPKARRNGLTAGRRVVPKVASGNGGDGGGGGDAAAPMAKKVFEKFTEQQKQPAGKQQVSADGETRAN